MLVLDTNVLSEPMRPRPDAAVLDWLNRQPAHDLYLNTVSMAEILEGVGQLPVGKRRTALHNAYTLEIFPTFGERILAFDRSAAECISELTQQARRSGHTVSTGDAMIGAISASRGFRVATRDTTPFLAMGLTVVNPWDSP